jgi:hypothetical protein
MQGMPGVGQTEPASTWQFALQPSFAAALPSSQFSPGSTRLFPQMDDRMHMLPGMQV